MPTWENILGMSYWGEAPGTAPEHVRGTPSRYRDPTGGFLYFKQSLEVIKMFFLKKKTSYFIH